MKILVTGANGFVGFTLCSHLIQQGYSIVRAARRSYAAEVLHIGGLTGATNWDGVLSGDITHVVHLAGVASAEQRPRDGSKDCREVNALATAHLARQCALRGVRRFVFLSTLKVLGEDRPTPYRADDPAFPQGPYAISKWEAEQSLRQIEAETGMEVVILRPPLVYGPGVKGNFLRLLHAADRTIPVPIGAVQNRRSLIYLGNLVDVIEVCLNHPGAAGTTFLVSDGEDVSSPELFRRVAAALGRRAFVPPIPVSWIRAAATVLGKKDAASRLTGSLAVDISTVRALLGWKPPYTMAEGLAATARWFRQKETEH